MTPPTLTLPAPAEAVAPVEIAPAPRPVHATRTCTATIRFDDGLVSPPGGFPLARFGVPGVFAADLRICLATVFPDLRAALPRVLIASLILPVIGATPVSDVFIDGIRYEATDDGTLHFRLLGTSAHWIDRLTEAGRRGLMSHCAEPLRSRFSLVDCQDQPAL